MSIQVLLADDSEVVRKAVAGLLEIDPDIELVGESADLSRAIELATRLLPQVVVIDLHMCSESGMPPSHIKSFFVGSRLLAISLQNDEGGRALAASYGAVDFIDKMTLADQLIPAIKRCTTEQSS